MSERFFVKVRHQNQLMATVHEVLASSTLEAVNTARRIEFEKGYTCSVDGMCNVDDVESVRIKIGNAYSKELWARTPA